MASTACPATGFGGGGSQPVPATVRVCFGRGSDRRKPRTATGARQVPPCPRRSRHPACVAARTQALGNIEGYHDGQGRGDPSPPDPPRSMRSPVPGVSLYRTQRVPPFYCHIHTSVKNQGGHPKVVEPTLYHCTPVAAHHRGGDPLHPEPVRQNRTVFAARAHLIVAIATRRWHSTPVRRCLSMIARWTPSHPLLFASRLRAAARRPPAHDEPHTALSRWGQAWCAE